LTVGENITLANMSSITGGYGIIGRKLDRDRVAEYIGGLNIQTQGAEQTVRTLSGGNQQKVVLAKLLNAEVDLFIFDELTRGVVVASKAESYQLMRRLAAGGRRHGVVPIA
jgi:ribose transport system ATP-binding protein